MLNNQDQATGLRRLMQCNRPRILGFLSTDSGTQTALMLNLAQALQAMQVDAVVVNTQFARNSQSNGGYNITEALTSVSLNVDACEEMAPNLLSLAERHDVVLLNASTEEFNSLQMQGLRLISPVSVIANTELVVQVTNKASSIKAAYMTMKSVCEQFGRQKFSVLVHDVSEKVALRVFTNLAQTAKQFMQVELTLIGHIPADIYLNKALQLGRSVVDAFPMAAAAKAFKALASQIHYAPSNAREVSNALFA